MNFDKHIAHLVMWKIKGESDAARHAHLNIMRTAFYAIKKNTPGLIKMEIGENIIDAPDAWDVVVYMVFSTRDALDKYLKSPGHLDVKKVIEPIRLTRGQIDFLVGE